MRLSDAMMLGDSLRTRNPDVYLSNGGRCGCAIGGALLAVGLESTMSLYNVWPWLNETSPNNSFRGLGRWTNAREIGSQFYGVCSGRLTFEQLVDYVRSIEPDEDTLQKMDEQVSQEVYA